MRRQKLLVDMSKALTGLFCSLVVVLVTANATSHQLLLIKAHDPTPAMLARWCHHLSNSDKATSFGFKVAVLFMCKVPGTECPPVPSPWCMPYERGHRPTAVALRGEEAAKRIDANPWMWSSAPELAFVDLHRGDYVFDMVWVLHQDVAWTGNVFELLNTLGRGRSEDVLCHELMHGHEGTKHGWWYTHSTSLRSGRRNSSAWDDSAGARRIRCNDMVVRYSAPFLQHLLDGYLADRRAADGEFFAFTVCGLHLENCTLGDFASSLNSRPFACCDQPVESVADWLLLRALHPSAMFRRIRV